MTMFAVISEGTVTNIIVADSKEIAEEITGSLCIEYTEESPAHVGLGWDGESFEQPPVSEPEPERELTEEEIWASLTPEQQANALRKRAEAENKTS